MNPVFCLHSDLIKFEETLVDYRRYKELLFKLAPPEWQEAQKVKKRANKDLSDKGTHATQRGRLKTASTLMQVNLESGYLSCLTARKSMFVPRW